MWGRSCDGPRRTVGRNSGRNSAGERMGEWRGVSDCGWRERSAGVEQTRQTGAGEGEGEGEATRGPVGGVFVDPVNTIPWMPPHVASCALPPAFPTWSASHSPPLPFSSSLISSLPFSFRFSCPNVEQPKSDHCLNIVLLLRGCTLSTSQHLSLFNMMALLDLGTTMVLKGPFAN